MSPVAKTFVVINLILSVAFVAFAGNLLHHSENYKKKFEAEVKAHNQTKKELQARIDKLEAKNKELQKDYDTKHNECALLENKVKSLTQELKDAKDVNNRNVENISQISATLDNFRKDIDEARKEIANLRQKETEAVKARDQAENEKLAMEDQVAELKNEISKLNEKIKIHEDTIAKLEEEKDHLNNLLSLAYDQGFRVTQPMKPVDAVVMKVDQLPVFGNKKVELVTLSVGKDDGVKKGYTFDIYNAGAYKGRVRIVEVDSKNCIGRVEYARSKIREGDKAKTHL